MKGFADVGCQAEAELTSIIPGITGTICGMGMGVCQQPGSKTLWRGRKIYGREVRKSITIAETACRKYGHCAVTQQNLLR